MTEQELRELLANLRELVHPHLMRSKPLRRAVALIGKLLIEESHAADANAEPQPSAVHDGESSAGQKSRSTVHSQEPLIQETVPLQLGDETARVRVTGTTDDFIRTRSAFDAANHDFNAEDGSDMRGPRNSIEDIDPEMIERRCRLKAEACRAFIDRRAAADEPALEWQMIERMNALIARAKSLPKCFLWVFWRERTQPDDDSLRMIARCYDALAAAAAVVHFLSVDETRAHRDALADAMQLMAEANSALRLAIDERTWLNSADTDQDEAHFWLRRETTTQGIYVPRHMRLDDPADPARAEDIIREAAALKDHVDGHQSRVKRIEQEFNRLQYHVNQLQRNIETEPEHDYHRVAEAIETLTEMGVQPTDRRFRSVMKLPEGASFPDELMQSAPLATVLRSMSDWQSADQPDLTNAKLEESDEYSENVLRVRQLLSGKSVVMIGGESRPEAEQRIKRAFDLSDVNWARLTEHGSSEPMRAQINRPDCALVIILIKLTGHQHAADAADFARETRVPCVLLKAGYNPEQIADAVLQQVSEQLCLSEVRA